jgi:ATP-dependent DNA helicase RecQ
LTVNTLIRTYGGLFDFETPIQKELISKKLNVSEKSIEEHLEFLNKNGLLWLEQHSGDLEITFLKPREDARTIHAFSKNLEKRQGLKRTKVQQMIDYVNDKEICRQIRLMHYFGEETQIDCGFCDVCAPEKPTGLEIESLIPKLNKVLSSGPKSSKDLILSGIGSEMAVLSCLQRMLEDEQLVLNPNNTYQLQ